MPLSAILSAPQTFRKCFPLGVRRETQGLSQTQREGRAAGASASPTATRIPGPRSGRASGQVVSESSYPPSIPRGLDPPPQLTLRLAAEARDRPALSRGTDSRLPRPGSRLRLNPALSGSTAQPLVVSAGRNLLFPRGNRSGDICPQVGPLNDSNQVVCMHSCPRASDLRALMGMRRGEETATGRH